MHREFAQQVRERREYVRLIAGRRPGIRRSLDDRAPKQPDKLRREYFADLRGILVRARVAVERAVLPMLPGLVADADRHAGRTDAGPRDAQRTVRAVKDRFMRGLHQDDLELLATRYARETSSFQKAQLGRQMKAIVGVEVPILDRRLRPVIEQFTAENVALITTIPERYFEEVEKRLLRSLAEGKRASAIAADLEERFDVNESSAMLIARDQIGKFFGALNEVRQLDLGIESFTWRTMNDNRVREAHVHLNGKRYSWDAPPDEETGDPTSPSEGVIPGEPINCRCWADPDVEAVLEALERGDAYELRTDDWNDVPRDENGRWVGTGAEKPKGIGEAQPRQFAGAFKAAFEGSPFRAHVSHYSEADLAKMKLFTTGDGKAGVAVKDHGDGRIEATALFNQGGEKGAGLKLLAHVIENAGVNYVECYGPTLNQLYERLGFEVSTKDDFNPAYASPDWDGERFDSPPYYTMKLKR